MRLAVAFCLMAAPAAAEWSYNLQIDGGPEYQNAGTVNSENAGSDGVYLSALAFGEGVDQGATCADLTELEIDYYFGKNTEHGGHILFTLTNGAAGPVAEGPAFFYDVRGTDTEITSAWAGFDDTTSVAIDTYSCGADGSIQIAVTFKGVLSKDFGPGAPSVRVNGTAVADFDLVDMREY